VNSGVTSELNPFRLYMNVRLNWIKIRE
jgi:hypothetical protein